MVLAGYVVISYIWSYSHLSKFRAVWLSVCGAAQEIAWGNKNK